VVRRSTKHLGRGVLNAGVIGMIWPSCTGTFQFPAWTRWTLPRRLNVRKEKDSSCGFTMQSARYKVTPSVDDLLQDAL